MHRDGGAVTDLQYYPTPDWAVRSLLESSARERLLEVDSILDPCAGKGELKAAWSQHVRTLTSFYQLEIDAGRAIVAGATIADSLQYGNWSPWRPKLVLMNPPFNRQMEFLERALATAPLVACVARSSFIGSPRGGFMRAHRPFILHLPKRFKNERGSDTHGRLWMVFGIPSLAGQWEMAVEY